MDLGIHELERMPRFRLFSAAQARQAATGEDSTPPGSLEDLGAFAGLLWLLTGVSATNTCPSRWRSGFHGFCIGCVPFAAQCIVNGMLLGDWWALIIASVSVWLSTLIVCIFMGHFFGSAPVELPASEKPAERQPIADGFELLEEKTTAAAKSESGEQAVARFSTLLEFCPRSTVARLGRLHLYGFLLFNTALLIIVPLVSAFGPQNPALEGLKTGDVLMARVAFGVSTVVVLAAALVALSMLTLPICLFREVLASFTAWASTECVRMIKAAVAPANDRKRSAECHSLDFVLREHLALMQLLDDVTRNLQYIIAVAIVGCALGGYGFLKAYTETRKGLATGIELAGAAVLLLVSSAYLSDGDHIAEKLAHIRRCFPSQDADRGFNSNLLQLRVDLDSVVTELRCNPIGFKVLGFVITLDFAKTAIVALGTALFPLLQSAGAA